MDHVGPRCPSKSLKLLTDSLTLMNHEAFSGHFPSYLLPFGGGWSDARDWFDSTYSNSFMEFGTNTKPPPPQRGTNYFFQNCVLQI